MQTDLSPTEALRAAQDCARLWPHLQTGARIAVLAAQDDIATQAAERWAYALAEYGSVAVVAGADDLAAAGAHDTDVVVLMHPFAARDAQGQEAAVQTLRAADEGRGLLVCDSQFAQLERVCTIAALCDGAGQLVGLCELAQLSQQKHRTYRVHFAHPRNAAAAAADGNLGKLLDHDGCEITVLVRGSLITFFQRAARYEAQAFSAAIDTMEQLFAQYPPEQQTTL